VRPLRTLAAVLAACAPAGCGADGGDAGGPTTIGEPAPARPIPALPRAGEGGELPEDGPAVVAGVRLPAGHRVLAGRDPSFEGPQPRVVAWQTDALPKDWKRLWRELAARFEATGLWPLVIEGEGFEDDLVDHDDWLQWAAQDPVSTFELTWSESLPDPRYADASARRVIAPFGKRFPGLAPPGVDRNEAAIGKTLAAIDDPAAIAIVPVTRPADAPAAGGWNGPVNWVDEPARFGGVLRSWEERYDALVVGLGVDTLYVAPRRLPPRSDLLRLAAEQYAACPDSLHEDTDTIRSRARKLGRTRTWFCWWD
jgi:hypothetical protein